MIPRYKEKGEGAPLGGLSRIGSQYVTWELSSLTHKLTHNDEPTIPNEEYNLISPSEKGFYLTLLMDCKLLGTSVFSPPPHLLFLTSCLSLP